MTVCSSTRILRGMEPELLSEIEAFLVSHEMKPTTFSLLATDGKDRHFVRQLRAGRRVWPETAKRIRQFMVTYRPPMQQAVA